MFPLGKASVSQLWLSGEVVSLGSSCCFHPRLSRYADSSSVLLVRRWNSGGESNADLHKGNALSSWPQSSV
jgi:hypothetical protein